jgi:hypothetical protein
LSLYAALDVKTGKFHGRTSRRVRLQTQVELIWYGVRLQTQVELIWYGVRWYLRYPLTYRDLEEINDRAEPLR